MIGPSRNRSGITCDIERTSSSLSLLGEFAGDFFHNLRKIECFCFEVQTLAAGEATEMPVRFLVDSGLPKDIATLSLSYTMFLVDAEDGNASQGSNTQANGNNAPDTAQALRL